MTFAYDALGRRITKTYRGKTTNWIWDGNVPLHEWIELTEEAVDQDFTAARQEDVVAVGEKNLRALLAGRPANGPPSPAASAAEASMLAAAECGTAEAPITWLFDPESFAPLAKLVGGERYGIVTDHLGTPRGMFDGDGREVWGADIDTLGDLRNQRGERQACPFRWPGQYEDAETGLYYNRFRYYDRQSGTFTSQDPLRLGGGRRVAGYPHDPLSFSDPLGLSACKGANAAEQLPPMRGMSVSEAEDLLRARGFQQTKVSNSAAKNQTWSHPDGSEVRIHPYGNESVTNKAGDLTPKSGLNAHVHKETPTGDQLTDRGIVSTNLDETHIGIKNPRDLPTVRNRAHGHGA